jgi:hypothetical protein
MKILLYLERAWIVAGASSLVVALYNLVTLRVFDNRVYFPFFCCLFCLLICFNIRGQRKFREKIFNEKNEPDPNKN